MPIGNRICAHPDVLVTPLHEREIIRRPVLPGGSTIPELEERLRAPLAVGAPLRVPGETHTRVVERCSDGDGVARGDVRRGLRWSILKSAVTL